MGKAAREAGRRAFLGTAARTIAVGAACGWVLGDTEARADDGQFSLNANTSARCGTCAYWGGVRRVPKDGGTVEFPSADATGWCNNPESPRYQSKTTPNQGPMANWTPWIAVADAT